MTTTLNAQFNPKFVSWLRHAAPYIHAFRNRLFVLAVTGESLVGAAGTALAHDCSLLASFGIRLVLVHGARPQIEAALAHCGETPVYHEGLRVTDAKALECVKSAIGVLRIEIEALFSQGLPNTPMAGAAMRILSGNFVTAKPVGVVEGVDFQYTGAVRKVAADAIRAVLDQQNVVLISPLGASRTGEVFNLSLEEVAEAVAIALQADKLIFVSDVPCITDEKGELLDAITADQAEQLLLRTDLPEALYRYLPCAVHACRKGVGRVHFVSQSVDTGEGALLLELFMHDGVGTVITRDALAKLREATIEDVGDILHILAPLEEDGTLVRRSRELLEMEIERFSVMQYDGMIIGCAALYPFSEERAAELAGLAILPDYRQWGYGEQLMQHIEARARKAGIKRLFLLTTRTAHWFIERGYQALDLDALPKQRRELYNYQRRSKVLAKTL